MTTCGHPAPTSSTARSLAGEVWCAACVSAELQARQESGSAGVGSARVGGAA